MDTRKAYIKAFIKARKEFSALIKDKSGQYNYASVTALRNALDDALGKYGLSYEFHIHESSSDKPDRMELLVEHDEGEQRHSTYPLMISQTSSRQNEHQGYGSAVSYAMRNLLRSFFALDSDDNDPDNRPGLSSPTELAPSVRNSLATTGQRGPNYGNPNKTVSEAQINLISRLIRLTNSDLDSILRKYSVESINEINGQQGSELICDLKKKQDD